MDINFKFSNLFGSAYKNGQIVFSPDGYSIYSPVGNKVSIFDLKNNTSRTMPLETQYNINAMTLNYEGTHLMVSTEGDTVLYVNLATETVIHTMAIGSVSNIQFSPDGTFVAVTPDNRLQLHEIGSFVQNIFRPFHITKTFHISSETLTSLDWSYDSRLLVTGSEGKQLSIVSRRPSKNVSTRTLGGHQGQLICTQFFKGSYDIVSVCSRGIANYWTCDIKPEELEDGEYEKDSDDKQLSFEKLARKSLLEVAGSGKQANVTAARFHSDSSLLVTAFDNGVFVLHEVPSFSLIHNLRVSDVKISTVSISHSGDWLALGCGRGTSAQLVVWEWQSETYVMKQQSHSERILSAKFSPDGSCIATGGEDGKVKIWSNRTGFCTVTFDEHSSGVSAVAWTQSGKAILSASLDGTVRAHDLKRYRNFRTLVCPEPTQLGALAVDASGDIVVAAAKDLFNVFIWSMENGHLLDVLSGHISVVSDISLHGNQLATVSWDKTIKMWDITTSENESVNMSSEALCVEFSPCGMLIAVLTLDSVITFFSSNDMQQIGTINASLDLDSARSIFEEIKRDKSVKNKSMTTMCFSPDGALLLVGGDSNYFCLYSVPNKLLMKKFTITQNRSLDGVIFDSNRRNYTEFGNMKLVDDQDEEDPYKKKEIKLAGTRHSDKGERKAKPLVAVYHVSFCPTGRRFSVCSTEGVAVYSLDTVMLFDPFQLDSSTSPDVVKRFLSLCDYSSALMAALRLNDGSLIAKCCQKTPLIQIDLVTTSLPLAYAEKLLKWISDGGVVWNSLHVHFYMKWVQSILRVHGLNLKGRTDMAILTGVQQIINHHRQLIGKLAEQNKFGLKYLVAARKLKRNDVEKKDGQMESTSR